MTTYNLSREGHGYPSFKADTIGSARSTVEDLLADEVRPGLGFRWIRVRPEVWRFQILDETTSDVQSSVDLEAV